MVAPPKKRQKSYTVTLRSTVEEKEEYSKKTKYDK